MNSPSSLYITVQQFIHFIEGDHVWIRSVSVLYIYGLAWEWVITKTLKVN